MESLLKMLLPFDRSPRRSSKAKRAYRELEAMEAHLKELLRPEDKKLVDELVDAHFKYCAIGEYERETDYFCLGAQLMLEILNQSNHAFASSEDGS